MYEPPTVNDDKRLDASLHDRHTPTGLDSISTNTVCHDIQARGWKSGCESSIICNNVLDCSIPISHQLTDSEPLTADIVLAEKDCDVVMVSLDQPKQAVQILPFSVLLT